MLKSPATSEAASDERFDGLVRLAKRYFGISSAIIFQHEAGRQWRGVSADFRVDAALPLCEAVTAGSAPLIVADTLADARFRHCAGAIDAPQIRFFAGCPLPAADGGSVGVFCLFDDRPRDFGDEQCLFLQDLARTAAATIDGDAAAARLRGEVDELRDSARTMALAIDGSGTGIWDRDVATGEIRYSSGWKSLLGYAGAEVSNRIEDSYRRVHPDDLAYVKAAMQAHFEQKTDSYEVAHRILCRDGSYKWISSRGKVVSRDSEGRALRMIGTTTDITALRAMAEKLQQMVDLMTSLTDEVPGLVFQYRLAPDGEGSFTYASAGAREIYEIEPGRIGANVAVLNEIIHPEDFPAYRASLEISAANLTPWHFEYRVQLPKQGLRWQQGHARPRRLEDGGTLWHGFITDITERKRIEAELHEFATIDFLTQLPNRRHFMMQIEVELAQIQRARGAASAVLMCDLDHFKAINDQWGHAVGDRALKHFTGILRGQLRKCDVAGRLGGEEFAVVLNNADIADATVFARRLQQRMAEAPLLLQDQPVALTISVGITAMTAGDANADACLSRSDMALYRAKENGRNRIEYA